MTRVKASFIHLLICCVIALALGAVMRLLWYPSIYFQALGGAGLVILLVGVDVVIGPLLTLVVFKPGKKSLKFDLAVIALLQISALIYGAHVVYVARPVFLVFSVDRFEIVTASDIDEGELAKAKFPEFASLPLTGPRIVAAEMPKDPKEREALLFSSLETGRDLPHLPKYYVPYSAMKSDILARTKSIDALGDKKNRLLDSVRNAGVQESKLANLGYLVVQGKRQDATAVIDRSDGSVLRLVPIDPAT